MGNEKQYLSIQYLDNKAKEISNYLLQRNYKSAANVTLCVNEFLKNAINEAQNDDAKKKNQMKQKYEHILQVIEQAIEYVEGDGKYSLQKNKFDFKQKELIIIIAILHDIGRKFEIEALGSSGRNMLFGHAKVGAEYLKKDNHLNIYLGNQKNFSDEEKEIILYCVEHHGDMDIPKDCTEKNKPYLEAIRKLDRIANLEQGKTVPVELITGNFTENQIAKISDENHDGVIDEITYAELTTGAISEDKTKKYKGVNRARKDVKYTPMRMYLSRVGWIYADDNDLDFYKYCKKDEIVKNYCARIRDYLADNEKKKLDDIVKYSEKFIDLKINELSEK